MADQTDETTKDEARGRRRAASDHEAEQGPETFSRERVLGPEGPAIAGVPHHVIVGALHGARGENFTREKLQQLVENFHTRPVKGD